MRKSNPLALKALEIIEEELKDQEEQVIKRASSLINDNKFTPDLALQFFYEIHALRQLPNKLKKQGRRAARNSEEKPVDEL